MAAMTRTSTVIALWPPTRKNSLSASTRNSRVCSANDMSPISSRNRVPPLACSNRPMRRSVAPVKAPFSWPNSSDSSSSAAIAEVFSATKGAAARGELSCSARATSSLPVPDSPVMSTVMLERDRRPMALKTSCIAGAWPMMRGVGFDGRLLRRVAAALARRSRDELDRFVDIERLRQIFERTALVRRYRAIEIRVRRDHDDRNVGIGACEPLHELEAAHVGHANVGDQYVGAA